MTTGRKYSADKFAAKFSHAATSGVVGDLVEYEVKAEVILRVVSTFTSSGTLTIQGRIQGSSTWTDIGTLDAGGDTDEFDIATFDFIRFNFTVAAGSTGEIVAAGFFKASSVAASAPATSFVPIDPETDLYIVDNFIFGGNSVSNVGPFGWAESVSGTAADILTIPPATEEESGTIKMICGTALANHRASLYCGIGVNGTGSWFFGGAYSYRYVTYVRYDSTSTFAGDGTDDFTTYNGFCNSVVHNGITDAANFYHRTNQSGGFWEFHSLKAGASETTTTSVAFALNQEYKLEIRFDVIATVPTLRAYIDGVLVATHITTIPDTVSNPFGLSHRIIRDDATATPRIMYLQRYAMLEKIKY